MKSVTLGGDRLGSGKKQKIYLKNYERSTHDLGYLWRSTMSAGTLVPFMSELALPGDTFDIRLDTDVLTHPTIGPLFGSYKVQLDVFSVPIRLYQAALHMNKLNIGLNMALVPLPQIKMTAQNLSEQFFDFDNSQINPSCIFSYLGMRGLGYNEDINVAEVQRRFNAVPYLAYFDIFKNYYANKQEETAFIIHNDLVASEPNFDVVTISQNDDISFTLTTTPAVNTITSNNVAGIDIAFTSDGDDFDPSRMLFKLAFEENGWTYSFPGNEVFGTWSQITENQWIGVNFLNPLNVGVGDQWIMRNYDYNTLVESNNQTEPKLVEFELENIDNMREQILQAPQDGTPYIIDDQEIEPYSRPLYKDLDSGLYSKASNQEGLLVKTYQSDLFNNWVSTDWISGTGGINEITSVNISNDQFTIDELNLKYKIYKMLMRIGVSGGTYDDWQESVYSEENFKKAESPVYHGGLIKELAFQSVISNAESDQQPLGTLAGRGQLLQKHKGGKVYIKVSEPSYIIGIASLTPRLDYSQGNKWDCNLTSMDDLHKPQLDQIGFQDLITDQMAWWDTTATDSQDPYLAPGFQSAGKQPAWINYMTNVNQLRGNFAVPNEQMWMTLNRNYRPDYKIDVGDEELSVNIGDLTTYIDPKQFNHIFAYTRRDAQNFWTQIKIDITARRKMSAKVMPNL